ncbi:PDR/VanB family oxidoreductase [Nocardia sienata]|uniref:PDR/VanB family oxidoreductase n=1 Tax=Nocardia sienata TaxID=248552 RepID=UPI0007A49AB5|nr:PDR/VanB family oxidoreductase [Nocardia sienata]
MNRAQKQIDVIVDEAVIEADGVVSVRLISADGGDLPPFDPGSHVDVYIQPGLVRQYSLCGDPDDVRSYRLGVLLADLSRGGSKAMHSLDAGHRITIGVPRNNFELVETAERSILVGGGIGITPLMSMAIRLHRLQRSFEFHYCARSYRRAAFLQELMQEPFGYRMWGHFDDGSPSQRFEPQRLLPEPDPGTHLYVCGPTGFMDFVTGRAKELGWSQDRIHIESFTADAVDESGATFTVHAARSGVTVEVPAGRSIADVLSENGIRVPTSCAQGICGTCITSVIDGVPDHRDSYLTDAEKQSNREIAVCCSRAVTDKLTLDV